MQTLFSCVPATIAELERIVSPARLARFSRAVLGDRNRALRLYIWNARLCEEFYLPLQLAEVTVRNAIHAELTSRYGVWHANVRFTGQLTDRYREELANCVAEEQRARGSGFTVDHVVGSMTFGFWVHLLTTRYENVLWGQGMTRAFPTVHPVVTRHIIWGKVDQLRRFRNRVFHHFAIFDSGPMAEWANLLKVLGWASEDAVWLVKEVANPARVNNAKPQV